ncbi:hypothetical protein RCMOTHERGOOSE_46 [Rhodobacter phage RcMotherGoose]|nr:hypothetical protein RCMOTHERGOOSE_46 [Rhodobacter phage RcMotherGoose]
MKICAQNPIQPEFTLCGDAFDIADTEAPDDDIEPFTFAVPGQKVTCEQCLRAIAFIHEIYTPKGKVK